MSTNTIVVGGGISGLVSACIATERGEKVTVIEADRQVGGLLRKLDYGKFGVFDCGMHNMYDTGVAALDEFLIGLLPASAWQMLQGEKRDLAGVYVNGGLQTNSPYIDLRRLGPEKRKPLLGDLMIALSRDDESAADSAGAFARRHFGDAIAETAILPVVRKLFRRDPDELDRFATQLTPLSRVILFDEEQQSDLMESALMRSRVAYPDQRHLPLRWSAQRSSYYPKQFGIHRVVDALNDRLVRQGARVLRETRPVSIRRQSDAIAGIECATPSGTVHVDGIDRLLWTAALPPLASLLGIKPGDARPDRPQRTVVTNLLLRKPARMGDLYYFYCYDPAYDCFRVTDYTAYCEGAVRDAGRPLCHEMLVNDDALESPEALARRAVRELVSMRVVESESDIAFARTEILASGFPMPTRNNVAILGKMRNEIAELAIGNLLLSGVLAEPGLFFQRDVLAHAYGLLSAA